MHQQYGAESVPPSAFSLSLHNVSLCICTVDTHSSAGYSDVTANTTAIPGTIGVHAPAVLSGCLSISIIFQAHFEASCLMLSWLPERSSCAKILLTLCMQPAAIALNYSVKKHTEQRMPDIYV